MPSRRQVRQGAKIGDLHQSIGPVKPETSQPPGSQHPRSEAERRTPITDAAAASCALRTYSLVCHHTGSAILLVRLPPAHAPVHAPAPALAPAPVAHPLGGATRRQADFTRGPDERVHSPITQTLSGATLRDVMGPAGPPEDCFGGAGPACSTGGKRSGHLRYSATDMEATARSWLASADLVRPCRSDVLGPVGGSALK